MVNKKNFPLGSNLICLIKQNLVVLTLLVWCVFPKGLLANTFEHVVGSLQTLQQVSAQEELKFSRLQTHLEKRLSDLNERIANAQKQLAHNAKKFNEIVSEHNACQKSFRDLSDKTSDHFLFCQELSLMDEKRIQELMSHLAAIKNALNSDLPRAFRVSH